MFVPILQIGNPTVASFSGQMSANYFNKDLEDEMT